jgi:hypothetical protein
MRDDVALENPVQSTLGQQAAGAASSLNLFQTEPPINRGE